MGICLLSMTKRRRTLLLVYTLLAAACLLSLALLWVLPSPEEPPAAGKVPIDKPPEVVPPPPTPPRLYLVLDDAGYSMDNLETFLEQDYPFSVAVLPGLANTRRAAAAVSRAGKDVILHMPMEPLGSQDPGPGALKTSMDASTIGRLVHRALGEYPGFIGINNHMGSRFTQDRQALQPLLQVAAEEGLLVIDSLTTRRSQLAREAREWGLPVGQRDVFLDNTCEKEAVRNAFEKALALAESRGQAVAIGHIWCPLLAEMMPELWEVSRQRGVQWAYLHQGWPAAEPEPADEKEPYE